LKEKVKTKNSWLKKFLIFALIVIAVGGAIVWYIFTEKFTDTSKRDAAFSLNAMDFIKEYQQNDSAANTKYVEKIITINGRVSEIENADTTINVKMIDTLTDAYIIFAFQAQDAEVTKKIKEGDSVSIKGSCSGGAFSEILETVFINFKRSTLNKQF
jgi:Cu/Ag efflux protein CusF